MMRGLILVLCAALPAMAPARNMVVNSPHNLSISGPGAYRSMTTRQVCVFCHAPHSVVPSAPLWNRQDTGQTYTQYSSSTLMSVPGQPAGSSRLCLACHDGTVALERLAVSPPGASRNPTKRLTGRSNLGTDLADDHPISFVYGPALVASNDQLAHPYRVQLPMENGRVRCGTCHDPHDSTLDPFLRMSSEDGQLCVACHVPAGSTWDWETSAHATSTQRPRGSKPWQERKPQWQGKTVAENACFNCHAPHNAATAERLITDQEEKTCYRCHDGSVARSDIRSDMFKPSRHPVYVTPNNDHGAAKIENPFRMRLHAECEDCHNPHGASDDKPMITVNPNLPGGGPGNMPAPTANAVIAGVTGITSGGGSIPEVEHQYEMCFKCHGVPGRSACGNSRCSTARGMDHTRADGTYNIRDKVDPSSNPGLVSYHPIVQNNPFNDDDVPSLRRELGLNTSDTLIYCTDCHNSDQSSAGNGSGAEGPHGSIYAPILSDSYALSTKFSGLGSASTESALCFKCHDESKLLRGGDTEGFDHGSHEEAGSCITCHDPHGSAVAKHLLNFGTRNNLAPAGDSTRIRGLGDYVEPTWIETPGGGECWLRCHSGPPHRGNVYPTTNGVSSFRSR